MRPHARAILIVVVVLIAGFLLFGYWAGRTPANTTVGSPSSPVGTVGTVNAEQARERGAELGEKAAAASAKVQETAAIAAEKLKATAEEAALTTKIKAKMALDDSVKARTIDVTTTGSTVTLSGNVRSVPEHDRAVALARETDGVTQVVDNLRVLK